MHRFRRGLHPVRRARGDATAGTAPYSVYAVTPEAEVSFTSHALSPGALLTLCRRLYGVQPAAYALAIPAHSFEVNAPFSASAAQNLAQTLRDLGAVLANERSHPPRNT